MFRITVITIGFVLVATATGLASTYDDFTADAGSVIRDDLWLAHDVDGVVDQWRHESYRLRCVPGHNVGGLNIAAVETQRLMRVSTAWSGSLRVLPPAQSGMDGADADMVQGIAVCRSGVDFESLEPAPAMGGALRVAYDATSQVWQATFSWKSDDAAGNVDDEAESTPYPPGAFAYQVLRIEAGESAGLPAITATVELYDRFGNLVFTVLSESRTLGNSWSTDRLAFYVFQRNYDGWAGEFDQVAFEGDGPLTCTEVYEYGHELVGDVNGDCHVDLRDVAEIAARWSMCNNPTDDDCIAP